MQRGIDHIVVCVNDVEATAERFRSFGFITTPVATHPWGTVNSLVQFDGNFIELLAIGDASKIVEPTDENFSFGAWNREWLKQGEGMSMLVFEGHDSRADVLEFRSKGIRTYEPFDFERKAKLPDGSEVTVAFSLAFALCNEMEQSVFFTCHQHAPQYFWKPEYQAHDNGAEQITQVTMVARDPSIYADFFETLQGAGSVTTHAEGMAVDTARGSVVVIDDAAWNERYPGAPINTEAGARFAAITVRVTARGRLPENIRAKPAAAGDRPWIDAGGLIVEFD